MMNARKKSLDKLNEKFLLQIQKFQKSLESQYSKLVGKWEKEFAHQREAHANVTHKFIGLLLEKRNMAEKTSKIESRIKEEVTDLFLDRKYIKRRKDIELFGSRLRNLYHPDFHKESEDFLLRTKQFFDLHVLDDEGRLLESNNTKLKEFAKLYCDKLKSIQADYNAQLLLIDNAEREERKLKETAMFNTIKSECYKECKKYVATRTKEQEHRLKMLIKDQKRQYKEKIDFEKSECKIRIKNINSVDHRGQNPQKAMIKSEVHKKIMFMKQELDKVTHDIEIEEQINFENTNLNRFKEMAEYFNKLHEEMKNNQAKYDLNLKVRLDKMSHRCEQEIRNRENVINEKLDLNQQMLQQYVQYSASELLREHSAEIQEINQFKLRVNWKKRFNVSR